MIPDYRDRWVVGIGTHYIAGLGKTFEGQHDGEPVPVVPGIVITRLQFHAMKFTNLSEAASLAKSLGGQVYKV